MKLLDLIIEAEMCTHNTLKPKTEKIVSYIKHLISKYAKLAKKYGLTNIKLKESEMKILEASSNTLSIDKILDDLLIENDTINCDAVAISKQLVLLKSLQRQASDVFTSFDAKKLKTEIEKLTTYYRKIITA